MKKVITIALLAFTMISFSACKGAVSVENSQTITKSDKEIAADILIAMINNDEAAAVSSFTVSKFDLNNQSDVIAAYKKIYSAVRSLD